MSDSSDRERSDSEGHLEEWNQGRYPNTHEQVREYSESEVRDRIVSNSDDSRGFSDGYQEGTGDRNAISSERHAE